MCIYLIVCIRTFLASWVGDLFTDLVHNGMYPRPVNRLHCWNQVNPWQCLLYVQFYMGTYYMCMCSMHVHKYLPGYTYLFVLFMVLHIMYIQYLHTYVGTYVYAYEQSSLYTYVCTYVHTFVYAYKHLYYMYICMYIRTYFCVCIQASLLYVHTYIHTCVCTYVCMCMRMSNLYYPYVCTCILTFVFVYEYLYYMYVRTYVGVQQEAISSVGSVQDNCVGGWDAGDEEAGGVGDRSSREDLPHLAHHTQGG